jgi:hypothetical protein
MSDTAKKSTTTSGGASCSVPPICHSARRARAAVGLGFLGIAGALATRCLPGGIALWPLALVPTWFGISHLVAAVTGYQGCPELGAIPSVMLGREVPTGCRPWEEIDRRLGRAQRRQPACCGQP